MKKLLSLLLSILTIFALISCNSGDTNMHKILKAAKDEIITRDDAYVYKSSNSYQSGSNENYNEIRAYCDGTNPRLCVAFNASSTVAIKDTSKNSLNLDIDWFVADHEYQYENQTASITANTVSMEVEYTTRHWDSVTNQWKIDHTYKAFVYNLDMNDYYENGEFSADGVSTIGDSECTQVAVDLLNDAFDGLNTIFTEKGYPIK